MVVACTQSGSQPVLRSADLAGTWVSSNGGSITFTPDHQFTAAKLDIGKYYGGCAQAPSLSGSGTWQFLSPQGDSNSSDPAGYAQGDLVMLDFESAADSPMSECPSNVFTLTSWNTGSKKGLCIQYDPDTPCGGPVFDRSGNP
jgi:hypothetical protein